MHASLVLSAHELSTVLRLAERVPEDTEVKAGWTALVLILALVAAVAVLGWSLSKQLKRAEKAKADGVYGDAPAAAADGGRPADAGSDDRVTSDVAGSDSGSSDGGGSGD